MGFAFGVRCTTVDVTFGGGVKACGDTSKAMLEARFVMKTFVKAPGSEGGARGN